MPTIESQLGWRAGREVACFAKLKKWPPQSPDKRPLLMATQSIGHRL